MKVVDLRALLPAVYFLKVQNHYPLTRITPRKMDYEKPIETLVAEVIEDLKAWLAALA
jgi:hypothetical protein